MPLNTNQKKLIIRVNPVNSIIVKEKYPFKDFLTIIKDLDSILRIKDKNCIFKESYKSGSWDGYVRFITPYGLFLTGLLPIVEKFYDTELLYPKNYEVFSGDIDYSLNGIALRDYQREAVSKVLNSGRGILKMPAGSGKTEVGCCIAKNLSKYGKVLWVTHTLDLVNQSKRRFSDRTNLKISMTTKGEVDTSGDVVISTIQTLHSRQEELKGFLSNEVHTVILDECHLGTANTWDSILRLCKSAWFRYGLSATPYTDDDIRNRKLRGLIGDIVYSADIQVLKDEGHIVNTDVCLFNFRHNQYMSYNDAMSYGVISNISRNKKIIDVAKQEKCGLILVNYIKHGAILHKLAEEEGLRTIFLYGEVSSDLRDKAIQEIKRGEYDCVIASTIFDFGVDIPEIRWVFLASPTKSSVRIIQRIGRGARKSKGKSIAKIYSFMDNGDRYLSSAGKKLLSVVEREGLNVIRE